MNKKGFTLIELLGVIILIGIVCVIAVPNLLGYLDATKKESRKTLMKSIRTAAQTYYEECENGDLGDIVSTNPGKYGNCDINQNNKTLTITIGNLANTGMIKIDEEDSNGKIVKDPTSKEKSENLNDCKINITKTKEEVLDDPTKPNGMKYTTAKYSISPVTVTSVTGVKCPTTTDLGN